MKAKNRSRSSQRWNFSDLPRMLSTISVKDATATNTIPKFGGRQAASVIIMCSVFTATKADSKMLGCYLRKRRQYIDVFANRIGMPWNLRQHYSRRWKLRVETTGCYACSLNYARNLWRRQKNGRLIENSTRSRVKLRESELKFYKTTHTRLLKDLEHVISHTIIYKLAPELRINDTLFQALGIVGGILELRLLSYLWCLPCKMLLLLKKFLSGLRRLPFRPPFAR